MRKNKLRPLYLKNQKSLSGIERQEKSLQIKEQFLTKFNLAEVRVLHLFLSMAEKGEVDTLPIIEKLWREFPNIKIVVPRVNFEKDRLEHLEFNARTEIQKSSWGISEPAGNDLIDERELDLVLVPLLCFDKRGYRVGYGKGFYDKFLIKCRKDCLKIGLSFFEPVDEIENVHEFDIRMDFCVTPSRVYEY
jgi:5-formyltetrahydrofolate cyclo-ligase